MPCMCQALNRLANFPYTRIYNFWVDTSQRILIHDSLLCNSHAGVTFQGSFACTIAWQSAARPQHAESDRDTATIELSMTCRSAEQRLVVSESEPWRLSDGSDGVDDHSDILLRPRIVSSKTGPGLPGPAVP
eukprot:593763-Hanusia_phi.AAC.2